MLNGHRRVFSDREINLIISKYKNGISATKICKLVESHINKVSQILKQNGIKFTRNRKDFFNENYFEKINTPEKAYILGFLYADGYNNEQRGTVTICISKIDIDILEKIQKCVDSKCKILVHNKNYVKICLHSRKFSSDLKKLGCYQGKSLTLKFPNGKQVSERFLAHFVRGYFDGDGCFYVGKNGCECNMACSNSFSKKLLIYIERKTKINCRLQKYNKICYFKVAGNRATLLLMAFLYKKSNLFLNRKYNKILNHYIIYKKYVGTMPAIFLRKRSSKYTVKEVIRICDKTFNINNQLNYEFS